MIVTTSGRPSTKLVLAAKEIAIEMNQTFINRNKQSVDDLKNFVQDDVLIVGKDRMELHIRNQSSPIFFHPNSAMFRIKRLLKNENDPLCDACHLQEGSSFLDCTLGLGADSIVASFVVGETGYIKGIEESKILAYLVKKGLNQWETGITAIDHAMKRIDVAACDHLSFLQSCSNHSFDVVYFDPMFDEAIMDSKGINPLRGIASYLPLRQEVIMEAKRVAKKRIVLKDHWKSERFKLYGFKVNARKSAKFHFGVIELSK